jgi:hypothetical protein
MFLWIPELERRVNNQFYEFIPLTDSALEKPHQRFYMGGKEGSIYGPH